MTFDTIDLSPEPSDFIPLSEHEAQTPGTFFGGKSVLHLHAAAAKLKIPDTYVAAQADVRKLAGIEGSTTNVDGSDMLIEEIDVWVSSRDLILFSRGRSFGLVIGYPTISVTAQDGSDVLLELNLSDSNVDDDDFVEHMHLRIAADNIADQSHAHDGQSATSSFGDVNVNGGGGGGTTAARALYNAIWNCQNLNPDPAQDGGDSEDDDGGAFAFDETAPGATGWITSENMAEFMDEDGNFKLPAEGSAVVVGSGEEDGRSLGAGAGRSRTAAEVDAEDGAGEEDGESKWQRTG